MLHVRLAGDHLYGKLLFTWLLLVMSLMMSFSVVPFPPEVLDEIWDLIESVSDGFLTYFCKYWSHTFECCLYIETGRLTFQLP